MNPAMLSVDESHPIVSVHAFDNVITFDGGGAYLGMVIASPLDSSERSMARLVEKQQFYLDSFFSDYGKNEWGTPREGKMVIFVSLHPSSSPAVFEQFRSFEEMARRRGVQVEISMDEISNG